MTPTSENLSTFGLDSPAIKKLYSDNLYLVEPFIMGRGRRFFADGAAMTKLRLVESRALQSGTLALIYQPANS